MSVVPQGRPIQSIYRDFRSGNLLVNRKYQRKLVWEVDEKKLLIDSILKGYPIPLILLAERPSGHGPGKWEIIDGIQRLNAICTFIEQSFDADGRYFDVEQFPTARQHADAGIFTRRNGVPLFSADDCARILDYQLALTIYPVSDEASITDLFGRINAGGRQLSPQERRQAGVTSQFSTLVRSLAAELRGDVSQDVLALAQMPEISIETARQVHGYGVRADDTLWCRQGVLSAKQLRQSEDEHFIADLVASIVLLKPLAASRESLDELYDQHSEVSEQLERAVIAYGTDKLSQAIKFTFSIIEQVVTNCSTDRYFLRSTLRPNKPAAIKAPFYAIFMAVWELVVQEEKSPVDAQAIITALTGQADRLQKGAHYETTENRENNISLTKGLIQRHFAARVPSAFGHGPSLALDLKNAIQRSRIESPRYEFKQGVVRLDAARQFDDAVVMRLIETACGIANLGPDGEGNMFIGIADNESDARRVTTLDGVTAVRVGDHYIVGVEREASVLGVTLDQYVQRIVSIFQRSALTDPLKTHVLGGFDTVTIHGLTVIRILIPKQQQVSFVGNQAFDRNGPSTIEVAGPQLAAVVRRFP